MAEYLHPGVYVTRRKGGPAPITGVSTSNFGICGFTEMGPTDKAELVTSFEQFQKKFGGFTSKGLVPTEVYAFFANEGSRAYVSRVVASDAEMSRCDYDGDAVTGQTPADTSPTPDNSETEFSFTVTDKPVVRGSLVITWVDAASATKTATDDGEGHLIGDVTTAAGFNTIDYETGAVKIKVSSAVKTGEDFSLSYYTALWQLDAKYAGVWGNDLRCRLQGNPDYWDQSKAKYTRYDFMVYLYDADLESYVLRETFEAVSLEDTTDKSYFPDVVNDPGSGSELVVVTDIGNHNAPPALKGEAVSAESVGTSSGSEKVYTGTLSKHTPKVAKTTVVVSFDISSTTYQIQDDGAGGWQAVGGHSYLDSSGVNAIDYDTGVYTFTLTTAPDAGTLPADYYQMPAADTSDCDLANGSDGGAITRSEVSHPNLKANHKGVYALGKTDEMMNVAIPDFAGDITVAGDLITEAEIRKDWFILLSPPSGLDPQEAKDYRQITLASTSKTAALYWPWIRITDPITGRSSHIPPMGHVAGVIARTDLNKNVGKSPAGVEDGRLNFSIGLEYDAELAELDILNPIGVNALYQSTETGRAVWGAKTLSSGEYRYINAQRTMMFLDKSLFRATHWVIFENNNSDLQVRIGQQVESFLMNLFRNNYFAGTTPQDAFFVVCDGTNNPQESVDLGRVICDSGVAINKPAEFLIHRLQQKTLKS
jgi:phage tail sheath protein FI